MAFRRDLHRLRGIAILCIVAGHSIIAADWSASPWQRHAVGFLFNNWTVVFVFIAGYLFHHLGTGGGYGRWIAKKTRTIAIPYALWSLPALLGFALGVHAEPRFALTLFGEAGPWRYLLYLLTGAHSIQMWFIPVILALFALAPLWRWAARGRDRRLTLLLIACVGLALLFPRGSTSEPLYLLRRLAHFSSCFVFGVWCAKHRALLDRRRRSALLGGLALATAAIVVEAISPHRFASWGNHGNYALKMALCPVLILALDRPLPAIVDRALGLLADLSFAIYFVHLYWIELVIGAWAMRVPLRFSGIPGWSWLSVGVLTCSAVVVLLLRRLAGRRSRILVGASPPRQATAPTLAPRTDL